MFQESRSVTNTQELHDPCPQIIFIWEYHHKKYGQIQQNKNTVLDCLVENQIKKYCQIITHNNIT